MSPSLGSVIWRLVCTVLAVVWIAPAGLLADQPERHFLAGFSGAYWRDYRGQPMRETPFQPVLAAIEGSAELRLIDQGQRSWRRSLTDLRNGDIGLLLIGSPLLVPDDLHAAWGDELLYTEPLCTPTYVIAARWDATTVKELGISIGFKKYARFMAALQDAMPVDLPVSYVASRRIPLYLAADPGHAYIMDRDQLDSEGRLAIGEVALARWSDQGLRDQAGLVLSQKSPCRESFDAINTAIRAFKADKAAYDAFVRTRAEVYHRGTIRAFNR